MNDSVGNFYKKENNPEYYKKYAFEHKPRLDFTVERFKLNEIKTKVVADFGCGAGFLLSKLDDSNFKVGFDGADMPQQNLLCELAYYQVDFEQPFFPVGIREMGQTGTDISFCMEVLEHLGNPYNLLCEIKKYTKEYGDIYITIPDEATLHNTIYPTLIFPHTNFEQFLRQMALPIIDHAKFDGNWKHHIWHCHNAPWDKKVLKYPKDESKFNHADPLTCTNI